MLQGKHVTKLYKVDDLIIHILINANFQVNRGDFIFLAGYSGAGKSTFLRILSAEEKPDHGEILFQKLSITDMDYKRQLKYRQSIGVIYQDYHLIEHKTIEENINFVLEALGQNEKEANEITHAVLETVGLYQKRKLYPNQLSGGEKRRITIARALAVDPIMILADEPTGDLDPYNTQIIMNLLQEIAQAGTSIIMATHNLEILKTYQATQYWFLHGGKLSTSLSSSDIKKYYLHTTATDSKIYFNIKKLPPKLQNKITKIPPLVLENIKHLTPKILTNYYDIAPKELAQILSLIK